MAASFADRKTIAELTAKMLLEIEAIKFYDQKPFIFTSGLASPVYTDCRRPISFPRVRDTLTLWHILSRVDRVTREVVVDRMIELTPLPAGVAREKALQLDRQTLETWNNELAWTW